MYLDCYSGRLSKCSSLQFVVRFTSTARTWRCSREEPVFPCLLRDDLMACFGQRDFKPADLSISQESCIHIWHGKEDKVVPFQLQRCILQKQPLINYHEIPQGGHMIMHYDSICDGRTI